MNLLRLPPFPLSVSYDGLEPSEDFLMEIYSDKSTPMYSLEVSSDSEGVIEKELPEYFSKFDGTYALYIYSLEDDEVDSAVVVDTLIVQRPYINPQELADSMGLEYEDAVEYEKMARIIIDSFTGGFYYKDDLIELVGLGSDYLPVSSRINRLNYVYRNNVKVFDRFDEDARQDIYVITPDHTAITIRQPEIYNRNQSMPSVLPLASSDSFNLYSDSNDPVAALTKIREFALFPKDYDYVVVGEFGWPVVPRDIREATSMLIGDISCNKNDYVFRYIDEYKTDQFHIKYGDLSSQGTGNLVVDNILKQYQTNFYKIGVI
jgi:hypothetical protein